MVSSQYRLNVRNVLSYRAVPLDVMCYSAARHHTTADRILEDLVVEPRATCLCVTVYRERRVLLERAALDHGYEK